jgi:hypothetical protein
MMRRFMLAALAGSSRRALSMEFSRRPAYGASSSAFDPAGPSNSRSDENLKSSGKNGRGTGFVDLGRTITGRCIARVGLALKKRSGFRIAFFFALPIISLGLSTPSWCVGQFHARKPGLSQDFKCTAFIETGRPGGAVTVPYGNVHRRLAKARRKARNRCLMTTLAQEGWGPSCKTWCVGVDH